MRRLGVRGTLLLALVAGLLPPRIASAGGCYLTYPLGTYQVRKMVVPSLSPIKAFSWDIREHYHGIEDVSSYHDGMAAFVYNPSTGQIPTYVIDYIGSDAPYGVVEVNGANLVNQMIPSTDFSGGHGAYHATVEGYLTAGTYWVVAFGFGADHGILDPPNTSTWSLAMDYNGVSCDPVNVAAQIVNYNNSHFRGGTHVYAPGAEVGKDINLSFDVAERNVFGLVYNSGLTTASFGTYRTPSCFNCGYGSNELFRLVSTNGHYSFTKTLVAGVDSSFDIDFIKLTLPPI
jgi:hypothetical protein